jgi:hypothetical protein
VLTWAFLGAILVMTIVGFIVAGQIEPALEDDMRYLLGGILIFVGFSCFMLTRFVVLPGIATQPNVKVETIASIGYGFAESPAIYGLVFSIMTATSWVTLPFSGMALLWWLLMSNYLVSVKTSQPDDFPRL